MPVVENIPPVVEPRGPGRPKNVEPPVADGVSITRVDLISGIQFGAKVQNDWHAVRNNMTMKLHHAGVHVVAANGQSALIPFNNIKVVYFA